jgi:hypothetical protein
MPLFRQRQVQFATVAEVLIINPCSDGGFISIEQTKEVDGKRPSTILLNELLSEYPIDLHARLEPYSSIDIFKTIEGMKKINDTHKMLQIELLIEDLTLQLETRIFAQ